MNYKIFLSSILTLPFLLVTSHAYALSIDWTGKYRFEWTEVDKTTLGDPGGRKAYGLNYLSLSPKIIAADGINVVSKFLVLSDANSTYSNSQFGQMWGTGFSSSNNSTNSGQSNSYGKNKPSSSLLVSELYLTINQEYGAILLGRAPFEFGMGITHNAGNGPFDHWSEIHDIAAYKFIVGNWFFMPAIGRTYDKDPEQGANIYEQIFQLQYQNDDTGSLIGYLQEERRGPTETNDILNTSGISGGVAGGINLKRTNVVFGRKWESLEFKMEIGLQSGDTGLINSMGEGVQFNGYGIAAEAYLPRLTSKWDYNFRFGMATGDDPNTKNYEAYQFDRNYDVAFLLFNHRLGQKDFFSTNLIKDQNRNTSSSYDDEAIGNAIYLSPLIGYKYDEHLDLFNSLTYAQLLANSTGATGLSKNVGFEWDFKVVYKPNPRIQWVNQLGVLFPGAAFRNGDGDLSNNTTYGFETKAAINF